MGGKVSGSGGQPPPLKSIGELVRDRWDQKWGAGNTPSLFEMATQGGTRQPPINAPRGGATTATPMSTGGSYGPSSGGYVSGGRYIGPGYGAGGMATTNPVHMGAGGRLSTGVKAPTPMPHGFSNSPFYRAVMSRSLMGGR